MSNIFVKIFGKVFDVLKYPFVHAAQMAHILDMTVKDAPQVKDCVVGLVEAFERVGVDAFLAIGQKGVNLPEDLSVLADAQKAFTYFRQTFLPQVEQIYHDLTGAAQASENPVKPEPPQPVGPEPVQPIAHSQTEVLAKETNSGLAPA
jgi:hypothetical protein